MFSGVHSGPWVGFSTLPRHVLQGWVSRVWVLCTCCPSRFSPSLIQISCVGWTAPQGARKGEGIRLTFAPRGPSQGGRWPQMEQSQLLAARAGVLILGLSHPSGCPRPALYWRPGICCCRGWCVRLYRPPQRGSKDSVARGDPGGV